MIFRMVGYCDGSLVRKWLFMIIIFVWWMCFDWLLNLLWCWKVWMVNVGWRFGLWNWGCSFMMLVNLMFWCWVLVVGFMGYMLVYVLRCSVGWIV